MNCSCLRSSCSPRLPAPQAGTVGQDELLLLAQQLQPKVTCATDRHAAAAQGYLRRRPARLARMNCSCLRSSCSPRLPAPQAGTVGQDELLLLAQQLQPKVTCAAGWHAAAAQGYLRRRPARLARMNCSCLRSNCSPRLPAPQAGTVGQDELLLLAQQLQPKVTCAAGRHGWPG
ncbi:hypothetical protein ACJJTC_007381 [Scirpophaga incertulas]